MCPEIKNLIEEFAEMKVKERRLDTPLGAYLMCDRISDAFIEFALSRGFTQFQRYDFDLVTSNHNPDPTVYQCGKHPVEDFCRAGWHAIVEATDFYLDFTVRQYHHEAAYPYIIAKKAAAAAGGK